MPRYPPHKIPAPVKRRSFELIRTGMSGRRPLRWWVCRRAAGRCGSSTLAA
jgi:hypothetical protein